MLIFWHYLMDLACAVKIVLSSSVLVGFLRFFKLYLYNWEQQRP